MTARNSRRDLHQPLALLVLLFGGIGWLAALYAAVSEAGAGMALLWTACAVALGVDAAVRALRAQSIGGVWWAPFRWWLESLVAPLFALVLVLRVGASMRVPAP